MYHICTLKCPNIVYKTNSLNDFLLNISSAKQKVLWNYIGAQQIANELPLGFASHQADD